MRRFPLIGLPTDRKQIGLHPFQAAGEKYIRALVDSGCGIPVLMPTTQPALPLTDLLDELDGVFLTGSPSNIEPSHYGDEPSWEGNPHDPGRDATTLSLVRLAIERQVPVLAVCRGLQEVNVALGGTLLQRVHEMPGFLDHREDLTQPLDTQYGPAHDVALTPGGWLAQIAGSEHATVNSLHGQGIGRLGQGLHVEARAPDGLIEAIRLEHDQPFLLALQWHPEWKITENPFSLGIFKRFAAAARARADLRA